MLHFRSFAQTILCGRLGQDAQLRTTKTGTGMLSFSIGTSVSAKAADGTYSAKTTWHDCLMFGPRIQKIAASLTKGSVVCVQGSISYREVELKSGYKGKTASILVDDIQILSDAKARPAAARPARQNPESHSETEAPFDEYPAEDIPC